MPIIESQPKSGAGYPLPQRAQLWSPRYGVALVWRDVGRDVAEPFATDVHFRSPIDQLPQPPRVFSRSRVARPVRQVPRRAQVGRATRGCRVRASPLAPPHPDSKASVCKLAVEAPGARTAGGRYRTVMS
jgi:hypothetical protein